MRISDIHFFTPLPIECCSSANISAPCLTFLWPDGDGIDLDGTTKILADVICPVLLDTIIQGDPRISSANIIWVNPDTNTWVRNPCKSGNGELALEIVLEKTAVKQSGDAWRVVLDSCLTVLHLIDTRRSIPYAIKQIQELLGISCTFDQAIQRLAASVKMVAKGVLREHLILLASSMTCGGNLVGFNTGGYKALARQLNIQVKSNEIEGMDVYSFLHMVKSLGGAEEETNACLGDDIDDLLEEENVDWSMSPQHTSGYDAVFEENVEILNGSASNGWDASTDQTETKSTQWVAWENNKAETKENGSQGAQENSWSSQKWKTDANTDQTETVGNDWSAWGRGTTHPKSNQLSTWGRNRDNDEVQDGGAKSAQENSWSSKKWKAEHEVGADTTKYDSSKSGAWDVIKDTSKPKSNDWSTWVRNQDEKQDGGSKRTQGDSWSSKKWKAEVGVDSTPADDTSKSGAWGGGNEDARKRKSNNWCTWGTSKDEIQDGRSKGAQEDSWRSQKWKADYKSGADVSQDDPCRSNWKRHSDNNAKLPVDNSSWGKPNSPENKAWDSQNESNQAASSQGWDLQIASANSDSDRNFQWGKQGRESFRKNRFDGSQGWGSNVGDGKNKNRPARAPVLRQDMFPPEEQDVYNDISTIMQSIRRIMQQQGYNDGDPLAADDQLFVLENVFEHHPDKESKMGAGIDHVMISRHSSFQESRCFYVVLKDGRREDFSYRKCLDNLVKKKYPDVAESFVSKYFRIRGRGDQAPNPVRDQTPIPADQAQTPVRDQTPAPAEQTQTPVRDHTPAPDQAQTPVPMEPNE
ncbi:hypothetical protein SESBI_19605 [Sesbania bispinosa]|nr:hypothetical protein SESBI_19605 [Sesbania bispinosa]